MVVDDTVALQVGGQTWSGWERLKITRGIERIPSSFEIQVTEAFPGSATNLSIAPGQKVVVTIGADTVLTGYVDRYMPSFDARSHTVMITGRGKCQDLVDCAAIFTGQQIMGSTAQGIAREICAPFGISVSGPDLERPIYQFNTVLTETPYAIIERIARYSALIAYEGTDGNLILAAVGTTKAASGFAQGINVQNARAMLSMDQRYSDIKVILTSIDTQWHNSQESGDVGLSPANTLYTAHDATVPRYRPHLVVSEQSDAVLMYAQLRANWELARRFGESQVVTLTCDSWRDSAGKLWDVNTLAQLNLPLLKIENANWLIVTVVFSKDTSRGTVADITLMPPIAFNPEPIILTPFDQQVAQDLSGNPAGPQPLGPS